MDLKYLTEVAGFIISTLGMAFLLGAAFQRLKSLEKWKEETRGQLGKIEVKVEVMENDIKHLETGIAHLEEGQKTILSHLRAHIHVFEKNFNEGD